MRSHLSPLIRQGVINVWHDRQIPPGTEWKQALDDRINQAQIVLLLISSDFLASDYCYEKEMTIAMERHERGEAIVLPIILRDCLWKDTPFSKLQALPKNCTPVEDWPTWDKAFTNIAEGIRDAVKRLRAKAAQPTAPPPKLRRPDLKQFGADLLRQEVREIKVANPYLLGDKFVGREKELGDLTDWLRRKENGILCISN
ncbi:MAG: toll/interleukin-1 receptor domain-containing protein, partial [Blastocatellia bacterium]